MKPLQTTHSKPIHAFIAGTHTTQHGQQVTIDATDLVESAHAYNPELHEAPLVIGHPDGKAPAYGWVESCSVDGNDFFITPKQVNPDFAELHNAGAFKKRSMSFYHPENKLNPVPGVWYPRHLGFLGAQPPAIKGLKGYAFEEADGDGDILTVDFGEFEDRIEAGMWRNLREWILAKFGKDDADAAVSGFDVDYLQTAAAQEQVKQDVADPAFSETKKTSHKENTMTPEEIAAQAAALKAQKDEQDKMDAAFTEREAKLADAEAASHRSGCADFIEKLVAEGRVLPAQSVGLIAFMASLDEAGTIEFGEGNDAVKQNPVAYLKAYLAAQPEVIAFGEHAGGEGIADTDLTDPNVLADRAIEYQESELAAGREITMTVAVDHIKRQGAK